MLSRIPIPARWLALGAALLITAAVYIQSLFFDFVYDDLGQIVYNPKIKSWHLAFTYFSSHVWSQVMNLALYYRPLYMLWLRVSDAAFGLNPFFWHLTTVALHLLVCALVYLFAKRLTNNAWIAVASALLFGVHPVHVETAAWVSGSTDSLMASFLLGSLLCYWNYRDPVRGNQGAWLASSLILAFFATLVKESAAVLPALIFAYEWLFSDLAKSRRIRLFESIKAAVPYAAVSLIFLAMRTLALKSLAPPTTKMGRLSIVLAWPKIVVFYIAHALIPLHMSVFYNLLTVSHPGWWNFVLPLAEALAVAAVLIYVAKRSRTVAFLGLWCAILLIPMLDVTLVNNVENLHDRYLYLPSVAVCILIASLLGKLKEMKHEKAALAALVVVAGGYAVMTTQEVGYWRNELVLAQHGMEVSPGHPVAPQVIGNMLAREGRVREAIPYLLDSLAAMPSNVETLCTLGNCYLELKALALAEECMNKALSLRPSEPRAHLVLGIIRYRQMRLQEAEAELRRGIELEHVQESITEYHYYLGDVLYTKGDVREAEREYRLELRNDPATDPAVAPAQARMEEIERCGKAGCKDF